MTSQYHYDAKILKDTCDYPIIHSDFCADTYIFYHARTYNLYMNMIEFKYS